MKEVAGGDTREARFWRAGEEGRVRCELCPHHCEIAEGRAGRCGVRGVRGGRLMALGYGRVSGLHLDPIEKKPLYHVRPGSPILSVGGWGCNLACAFCQNWCISQQVPADSSVCAPEHLAESALRHGSVGVAYTYNEPLIGFEFVRDCAVGVREQGGLNVLVTNGYVEAAPAAELLPLVDALNIDIKSMEPQFYATHCRGSLEPVLRFAEQAHQAGRHVEITNLVIPTLNDRDALFEALADWMREHLGENAPLHLSAYRPEHKMRIPPTPVATLERAYAICRARLHYVYMGNVLSARGQNTDCPGCGATLVARQGYAVRIEGIRDGACGSCGRRADVIL